MAQNRSIKIGVAGVTGKLGGLLLDNLLGRPNVHVRGYCRNASKLGQGYSQLPQLETIEGDALDRAMLGRFVDGLDVVICAYLGEKDLMINAQKALIDACDEANVSRYIASDYTFDYTKLQLGDHPVKDSMKIVHEYVNGKDRVKGVHILVGALMETFWSSYIQVWNPEKMSLTYWGTGEEQWESTTFGDAARFTAAVALEPSAVGLQKFLGDKKNIREIAQAMQHVYGIEPKLERQGSLSELYTTMHSLFEKEPSKIAAWLGLFYQYYLLNGQTHISDDLDNINYPHIDPKTFQAFMGSHALDALSGSMMDLGKRG